MVIIINKIIKIFNYSNQFYLNKLILNGIITGKNMAIFKKVKLNKFYINFKMLQKPKKIQYCFLSHLSNDKNFF